jgi:hypothetical protein
MSCPAWRNFLFCVLSSASYSGHYPRAASQMCYCFTLLSWGEGGGARLSPLGTSATVWPIIAALDDGECGAVHGMIGRGNRSVHRKSFPVPFCPPQIPLAWAATWVTTVGRQCQLPELWHSLLHTLPRV